MARSQTWASTRLACPSPGTQPGRTRWSDRLGRPLRPGQRNEHHQRDYLRPSSGSLVGDRTCTN
ncbi:MAG: hypothetical protein JXA67_15300 [Micromonosporaceae bacterium]|nr:hypothetical protein [Micromonosporaceae bacterium]